MFRHRKIESNSRTMIMNTNGFRTNHTEKIDQMIECFKHNKIDIAMLSETNWKWTTRTTDTMSSKMKEFGRETRCYYLDRKAYETTDSDWLQGGMMSVTIVKISSII